jgi:CheY-like chemotaxis protein
MNGIIGMLSLMEQSELNKDQQYYLSNMRTCGEGLLVVINDILDISKLEAGKLDLEYKPFDLKQMVDEICLLLDSEASNKGLIIEVFYDEVVNKAFIGDKLRIRQILLNIFSNAIKFTDQGSIKLDITATLKKDKAYLINFKVTDNGIGISPEGQQKLFKPFSQVDNSISRRYGGTGLGLTISAQLVKQMGGDIGVESNIGCGATFYFTIELVETSINDIKLVSVSQNSETNIDKVAEKFPLKILIAEDNKINQIIAQKVFQQLGYKVTLVSNGQEAVDAVNKNRYDVIFMDMQMPIMDGVTATLNIIKQHPVIAPKIIAMTANVLKADREKCFAAGMIDFIGKPINVDDIITAIEKLAIK